MKYLKHTDKPLLLVSSLLFLIGLVMIFSASNVAAMMRYHTDIYQFFKMQSYTLIVGFLVVFLIGIKFHTKTYTLLSWIGLFLFGGMLVLVNIRGLIVNNAKSWFDIGPVTIQPSEFIKVILIIWFAAYFELNRKSLNSLLVNIIPFVIAGIIVGLIVLQPDLGTASIIVALVYLLYLLIPSKKSVKINTSLIIGGVVIILGLIAYIVAPGKFQNAKDRLDFKNPCSEEKFYSNGNQVCNSFIAFNNGGLFGKGLGKSTQKYLYLSDSHTDFIFAIIIEELGFFFGVFILFLYMILLWRIILIGRKSKSSRGSIISYGVAIYIFLHIAVNLLGIMGVIPITGVPLPFMSYGGSFAISLIIALTAVQRVAIEIKLKQKKGK